MDIPGKREFEVIQNGGFEPLCVTIDIERILSSRFIRSTDYGTRAWSIVKFDNRNQIRFIEQNYTDSETDGELISENIKIKQS